MTILLKTHLEFVICLPPVLSTLRKMIIFHWKVN